jgi:hypothetical protein
VHLDMNVLENISGIVGLVGSFLSLGVIFLGIPWALYTLARIARTTDELARLQRDLLRELRRTRTPNADDQPTADETDQSPEHPGY